MSYAALNQQIENAQRGVARLSKIESMLKELQNEHQRLEKKVKEIKPLLDKEKLDVEKLENNNLTSVFYSILGNLEEHMEKEHQEYLAAKLKYDQAVRDLSNTKRQIVRLTNEQSHYVHCESEYYTLYQQKRELLIQSDAQTAQRIMDLSQELNKSNNNIREIEEAIAAGNNVKQCLDNALISLNSAEGWGMWDMLGGGLISNIAKHSHVDSAKSEVEQAQTLLYQFKSELADVRIDVDIFIETEGFAKFADFFFDGLIADWYMQSKIQNAHGSVSQVSDQVQDIIGKLNLLKDQEIRNTTKIEKEVNTLIMNA
ncbi:MAG: hypothetical protein ACOWWR_13160 [Eubacteriales bacterium]